MIRMVPSSRWPLASAALFTLACATRAAPVAAPTYPFAEVPKVWEGPIWVEFLPGDEIPLWMKIAGGAVEPVSQVTTIRVRRAFYLLYDRDRIALSYDRRNLMDPAAGLSVLLGGSADHESSFGFTLRVPPDDPL